jgi:hypothetical protein
MKRRRSLTIDDDVDTAILHYRGHCIKETLKDKSYTEAVNELLREILKQKGFIEGKKEKA